MPHPHGAAPAAAQDPQTAGHPARTDGVRIEHPHARLLVPVATTLTRVAAGDWAIAAELCRLHLADPVQAAAELNVLADSAGLGAPGVDVPPLAFELTDPDPGSAAITFGCQPRELLQPLDMFMRVQSGQWSELGYWSSLLAPSGWMPPAGWDHQQVNLLRCRLLRDLPAAADLAYRTLPTQGPDACLDVDGRPVRLLPDHPAASVGIAESQLAARLAYHVYKELGGGTPGAPTFSLPSGPVSVTVTS